MPAGAPGGAGERPARPVHSFRRGASGLFRFLLPAMVALLVAAAAAGCGGESSPDADPAAAGDRAEASGTSGPVAGAAPGGGGTSGEAAGDGGAPDSGSPEASPAKAALRTEYALNLNSGTFPAGGRIPAPYYPDEPYYFTAKFPGTVDPAAVGGRIRVIPAGALMDTAWRNESGRGEARLRIKPLDPGETVEITFPAGMPYGGGGQLEQDETIVIEFLPPTEAEVIFEGLSYLPGGGKRVFKSAAGMFGPWPLMKPGEAAVTISFSRKMRTATVARLLENPPFSSFIGGPLQWNDEGTAVTVPLHLPADTGGRGSSGGGSEVPSSRGVGDGGSGSASRTPSALLSDAGGGSAPVDELGMYVAIDGSSMAWQAAPAGEVRRVEGNIGSVGADPANGRGVGSLPRLPELRPADGASLRGTRLLTWHHLSGDAACGTVGLTVWDITEGTGIPLGRGVPGCGSWAAWAPDGESVLYAGATSVHRFHVPAETPLEDLLPDPSSLEYDDYILKPDEVVYDLAAARPAGEVAPGETGTIRGFAPAPDGRMALFHLYPPAAGLPGGSHLMDLVIIDEAGRELSRMPLGAAAPSPPAAAEPGGDGDLSIPAGWSSDGRRLAFIFPGADPAEPAGPAGGPEPESRPGEDPSGEAAGTSHPRPEAAGPGGSPSPLPAPLYIWDDGAAEVSTATVGGVTDLSWRPGTSEVLVKIGDGWYLYDTDGRTLTDVALMMPRPAAWSADGRWVFGRRPGRSYAVADLRSRQVYKTPGWLPLGWNPADNRPYWLRIS